MNLSRSSPAAAKRAFKPSLLAVFGKGAKGAEALRDQIRLRDQVYKIKNMVIYIGSDNSEVTIARLMAALPSVLAVSLPKEPPPRPVPYPKRAAHPAPTRSAVAFELKHLVAISAALS
jgi:hypothetical protein